MERGCAFCATAESPCCRTFCCDQFRPRRQCARAQAADARSRAARRPAPSRGRRASRTCPRTACAAAARSPPAARSHGSSTSTSLICPLCRTSSENSKRWRPAAMPLARHQLRCLAAASSSSTLVDALRRHRHAHDLAVLEDVQHVGRRGAERAPGRGGLALRNHDLSHAQLAREHAGVRRSGAAEREQHEVARIEAFLHRHLADHVGHLQLDDAADAGGGFHGGQADALARRWQSHAAPLPCRASCDRRRNCRDRGSRGRAARR